MPAKEIKELRQAGNLSEALELATAELQEQPANIWARRNISWVYFDYLKQHVSAEQFDSFLHWLDNIKRLELSAEETLLYEQVSWQVGKMMFALTREHPNDVQRPLALYAAVTAFPFPKPSDGYSILFKAFHKALKDTDRYLAFADWWGLQHLRPQDFMQEKNSAGKSIMAVAEQAYITYAKQLLPRRLSTGEWVFDRQKAEDFVPALQRMVDEHPEYQYPAYFLAKLLLALGTGDNVLSVLLPFAKKKRNDFWVWEILAEAFSNDPDKNFACYCKALSCKSPPEMLIGVRQRMAAMMIGRQLYDEAKTEIEQLVSARSEKGYKIPAEITSWQQQPWYSSAKVKKSNIDFYQHYTAGAEAILFSDVPEEMVIVEFVNTERKILHFIASESKFGFFKYDRFFREVNIGDTLRVRFQDGANEGLYQVYTAEKQPDKTMQEHFLKEVNEPIHITAGKAFGFVADAYVHPSLVSKYKLTNGSVVKGVAIKTYNTEKKAWTWKVFRLYPGK